MPKVVNNPAKEEAKINSANELREQNAIAAAVKQNTDPLMKAMNKRLNNSENEEFSPSKISQKTNEKTEERLKNPAYEEVSKEILNADMWNGSTFSRSSYPYPTNYQEEVDSFLEGRKPAKLELPDKEPEKLKTAQELNLDTNLARLNVIRRLAAAYITDHISYGKLPKHMKAKLFDSPIGSIAALAADYMHGCGEEPSATIKNAIVKSIKSDVTKYTEAMLSA